AASRRHRVRLAVLGAIVVLLALAALLLITLSLRLRALREFRAVGPSWSFPSRIYSDRLALERGRLLPPATLEAQLTIRGYERAPLPLARPGTWAAGPGGAEVLVRGAA